MFIAVILDFIWSKENPGKPFLIKIRCEIVPQRSLGVIPTLYSPGHSIIRRHLRSIVLIVVPETVVKYFASSLPRLCPQLENLPSAFVNKIYVFLILLI